MPNHKEQARVTKKLRLSIPKMECRNGCYDCCGIVPMNYWEFKMMGGDNNKLPDIKNDSLNCQFLTKDGCANYSQRPIVCRLFAAISKSTEMRCPHGHKPKHQLSKSLTKAIMNKYLSTKPTTMMNLVGTKKD